MVQRTQEPLRRRHKVVDDQTVVEQEIMSIADGNESYKKQLSEEIESLERHARELRQTPGLEHLTEEEAREQVNFMFRFSSWVFNQYMEEQSIAMVGDVEVKPEVVKDAKI